MSDFFFFFFTYLLEEAERINQIKGADRVKRGRKKEKK